MLQITLKSGIVHNYPSANLNAALIEERLKEEVWTLISENNVEIYRTNEIAHVSVSKHN